MGLLDKDTDFKKLAAELKELYQDLLETAVSEENEAAVHQALCKRIAGLTLAEPFTAQDLYPLVDGDYADEIAQMQNRIHRMRHRLDELMDTDTV